MDPVFYRIRMNQKDRIRIRNTEKNDQIDQEQPQLFNWTKIKTSTPVGSRQRTHTFFVDMASCSQTSAIKCYFLFGIFLIYLHIL